MCQPQVQASAGANLEGRGLLSGVDYDRWVGDWVDLQGRGPARQPEPGPQACMPWPGLQGSVQHC